MKRAILIVLAIAAASCGDLTRQGTASSYLIITRLEGATFGGTERVGGTLLSDVVTVVDGVSSVFNDNARVEFELGLKDPGSAASPNAPTSNNFITVNRYRVRFIRADGRNVPGVDVPHPFDGAFTLTVAPGTSAAIAFVIVRHQAKREAPLTELWQFGQHLSTIAEVTFFGRDQTGREVSVTGQLGVNFGNFGDPE